MRVLRLTVLLKRRLFRLLVFALVLLLLFLFPLLAHGGIQLDLGPSHAFYGKILTVQRVLLFVLKLGLLAGTNVAFRRTLPRQHSPTAIILCLAALAFGGCLGFLRLLFIARSIRAVLLQVPVAATKTAPTAFWVKALVVMLALRREMARFAANEALGMRKTIAQFRLAATASPMRITTTVVAHDRGLTASLHATPADFGAVGHAVSRLAAPQTHFGARSGGGIGGVVVGVRHKGQ